MKLISFQFADDGSIPNNILSLILYAGAFELAGLAPDLIESRFTDYGWPHQWRNGIYPFHHYHSTSHEVLGCYRGSAEVLFGGEQGRLVDFRAGDVVLIPAGVGHCNKGSSPDFAVVGAYPRGCTCDILYGHPDERPKVLETIAALPIPHQDPVLGEAGGLLELWAKHGSG